MATATLNVYVTELGEPCTITNRRWVVAVAHCDGRVLNWSGGRYRAQETDPWTPIPAHVPATTPPTPPLPQGWYYDSIPAHNGHVEIALPPGMYVIRATMHSWYLNGVLCGNWATDHAIVRATCGQDACVTLYAPTAHKCGIELFAFVIPLLQRYRIVGQAEAEEAIEAMRRVSDASPMSSFEREQDQWLKAAFAGMTSDSEPKDSKQE